MNIKTRATNIYLHALIRKLRKIARENNAKIWHVVAEILARPKRKRVVVNLAKINRLTKKGDIVIVPGKILGSGELNHPVTIAAYSFSESAQKKIVDAGGKSLYIQELAESNPKGSNVRIII